MWESVQKINRGSRSLARNPAVAIPPTVGGTRKRFEMKDLSRWPEAGRRYLGKKTRTVTRFQYPITAAYCFTDYRSQGQTIPHVVIDIASPPSSKLSLFNLYVALSRSSGWETIRLLQDFDDDIFLVVHEPELTLEDERLDALDKTTKLWWQRSSQVDS